MIALHSVYVVTLVSQATSALVLLLLIWSDRRSRGLVRLAVACTFHTAALFILPRWLGTGRWPFEATSAAILPFMFFLFQTGLSQFLGRREQTPLPARIAVALSVFLAVAVAPWSTLWSLQIARVAAIVIIVQTIRMLWGTEPAVLRIPTRITAGLLLVIAASLLLRLPIDLYTPSSRLVVPIREVSMIGITLLAFSFLVVYMAESQRLLTKETRLDPLTGLLNRRALEEQAAMQLRHAGRSRRPLALLMMDLDAFKLLNDTWGHSAGDRALCAVGFVLLSAAKNSGNIVARLGGEEFAMLLPDHTLAAAEGIAERLRSAIAALSVPEGGRRVTFTVSIGVAAWHAGETTWTEMLQRADTALYRAKREGRNRVVLCEHPKNASSYADSYGQRRRAANQSSGAVLLEDEEL